MTPAELITAATKAVEREDFTEAHRCYLAAWNLLQAGRTELEAARREADDRAQLRSTIVDTAAFLAGIVATLSLLWM